MSNDEIKIPDSIIKNDIDGFKHLDDLTELEKLELKKEIDIDVYRKLSKLDFLKFQEKVNINEYDYHSDAEKKSVGEDDVS